MECRECSSDMTAFLDGELSQTRHHEVRSHIDGCLACARELAAMREAADFVHAHHRNLEPHPAGWNRVQARLDSAGKSSWQGWLAPGFHRWQPVAIALTLCGLMIGLSSYYQRCIESRSLEHYMTQYEKSRERPVPPQRRDPENPFVEVHQTIQGNPFRR
jgi:hypothetical protein